MTIKTFRDAIIQDAVDKDEANRTITFIASNETLNRHGHIVKQNWNLDNFKENAVIFWNHQSEGLPIGVATKTWVNAEKGLMTKIKFAEADANPMADSIFKLYNAGILRAVSAGYTTNMDAVEVTEVKKGQRKIKCLMLNGPHELLEISCCGLPSNPEALKQNSLLQDAIKEGILDELELNDLKLTLEGFKEEPVEEIVEENLDLVEDTEHTDTKTDSIDELEDTYKWFYNALESIKRDLSINNEEDLNDLAASVCESLKDDFKKDSEQTNKALDEILSKFIK